MNRSYYLTDAMVPGVLGIHHWNLKHSEVADIVVSSELANHFDIAEMRLNLKKFALIDQEGKEFFIRDFPGQRLVRIRGIADAAFLVTKRTDSFKPGMYDHVRFYIEPGVGTFIHTDRTESETGDRVYLDFKIDGNLKIDHRPPAELVLRFDFPPYRRFDASFWRNRLEHVINSWKSRLFGIFSQSNS